MALTDQTFLQLITRLAHELNDAMENRGNIETALDSKRGRYGFFQVRPKVE